MSATCQSYYTLENPAENIDKTHEFFTIYYLFQIFKELNPHYFDKNNGPGRPRIYTPDIMLPFVQWGTFK